MIMIIFCETIGILLLEKGDVFTSVKGRSPRLLASENEGYVRDGRY